MQAAGMQDALAALEPCTPSILVLDEACMHFAPLGQQLPSLRHIIVLGMFPFDWHSWRLHHHSVASKSSLKHCKFIVQAMVCPFLRRCRAPCQLSS